MKIVKRENGYWVTDFPLDGCLDCGPYETKTQAEETQRGLQRTFDHWDDRKYWTVEK
jgi:hypothetical protein